MAAYVPWNRSNQKIKIDQIKLAPSTSTIYVCIIDIIKIRNFKTNNEKYAYSSASLFQVSISVLSTHVFFNFI